MIPILDKIRRSGGSVVVVGDKVWIAAPPGLLSNQERQLLAKHKQDLLRLFEPREAVVDPYQDQERQSIKWVENLDPAKAALVVGVAVQEWDDLVRLDQQAPEPTAESVDMDRWLAENTIPVPDPCGMCGGIDQWQDYGGTWHCQKCEPPLVQQRLRLQAARLWKRAKSAPCPNRRRADNEAEPAPDCRRSRLLAHNAT